MLIMDVYLYIACIMLLEATIICRMIKGIKGAW